MNRPFEEEAQSGGMPWFASRSKGAQPLPGYRHASFAGSGGAASLLQYVLVLTALTGLFVFTAVPPRTRAKIGEFFGVGARQTQARTFTVGATEEEVMAIQGRPDSVSNGTWTYGKSEVYFRFGRVVGWRSVPPVHLRVWAGSF